MKKQNWIFMPHAGHLIVGDMCQFRLNTYVGKYIVSTVGEYWPDRIIREIYAKVYDPQWYEENKHLRGDEFDFEYLKKFGYMKISAGKDSIYETMVFKARKSKNKCCPYEINLNFEKDCRRYATDAEAVKGHYEMCEKWSKK